MKLIRAIFIESLDGRHITAAEDVVAWSDIKDSLPVDTIAANERTLRKGLPIRLNKDFGGMRIRVKLLDASVPNRQALKNGSIG